MLRQALLGLALCLLCPSLYADIRISKASSAGFSKERLAKIEPAMQRYIDEQKLAGILTLVARNDRVVHLATLGYQNREAGTPLTQDSIFRIYSMTKPVTVVAALTLWEQGKFHMFDPIGNYLPELKNLHVYVSGSGDNIVTEPANKPVRIIDLFLHTSGFSYGFSNSEVDKLYQKMTARDDITPDNVLAELAKLPLVGHPGEQWNYGVSTDIIGHLVERITGKKLGEYMQDVIFDPLGMADTGFYVKPENVARFSEIYTPDKLGNTVRQDNEPLGDFLSDPAIHNGGGGLVSTARDYLTFAQMLLNGGEYKGIRILSPKTVEYMRSNHLPEAMIPFQPWAQGEGYALGMSVTVDESAAGFLSSTGNYGWAGMGSTYFRIDPSENLIILSMAQFIPIGFHRYQDDFRNLTYQALIHPNN